MISSLYQICECEELQKTVASLKQQLSEAVELKNFSPVSYSKQLTETKSLLGELCTDKGNAALKDPNDKLLLQQQVFSSSVLLIYVSIVLDLNLICHYKA